MGRFFESQGSEDNVIRLSFPKPKADPSIDEIIEIVFDEEQSSFPIDYIVVCMHVLEQRHDIPELGELCEELDQILDAFENLKQKFYNYLFFANDSRYSEYCGPLRVTIQRILIYLEIADENRVSSPELSIQYCRERLGGIFENNRILVTPKLRNLLSRIKEVLSRLETDF